MPSDRYAYYLEQSKIHHVTKKTFSGNGCLKHAATLVDFSRNIGATSALDYGCGKGNQYRELEPEKTIRLSDGSTYGTLEAALGYTVDKFDPAVKGFHKTDLTFPRDLVWCTDVLEHIPEEDMDWVISELLRLGSKGLFVTVGTYPAKKQLPNGENTHITVKDADWWRERFNYGVRLANKGEPGDPFQFMLLVE